MYKFLLIVLFFLASFQVFSQSKYGLDIYFVSFPSGNQEPETKYYSNGESIKAMYKKYNAERLPMRIAPNGQIEVLIACDDILNVGICVPTAKYNSLSIQSALRVLADSNKIKLDTSIPNLVQVDSIENGLMFIRLDSLLKKAYYKKELKRNQVCCPEEDEIPWQDALKRRLCPIVQGQEGLKITLVGSKENQVVLRSLGLGPKHLSDDNRLQKIEPRQYVTIYEKENINGRINPIWWLEKQPDALVKLKYPEYKYSYGSGFTKFYPIQKFRVVDQKSILEIRFDQEMLANNIDFYGNISLSATINDIPIEVSPYSVIGKPQKSYGVNSKPIKEIANHFINLLETSDDIVSISEEIMEQIDLTENKEFAKKNETETKLFKRYLNEIYIQLKSLNNKLLDLSSHIPLSFFDNAILEIFNDSFAKDKQFQLLSQEIDEYKLQKSENPFYFLDEQRSSLTFQIFFQPSLDESTLSDNLKSIVNSKIKKYNKDKIDEFQDLNFYLVQELRDYIIENSGNENPAKDIIDLKDKGSVDTLLNNIDTLLEKTIQVQPNEENGSNYFNYKDSNVAYSKTMQKLELIISLMDYFNSSGRESKEAFLNISQFTVFEFDKLLVRVKSIAKELPDNNFEENLKDPQFRRQMKVLISDFKTLRELDARVYVELYGDTLKFKKNIPIERITYNKAGIDVFDNQLISINHNSTKLNQKRSKSIELIAKKVGEHLFSRMLYATIDLAKAGAKDDDVIEIKVMWYNIDPNTPNAEEGIELSTAKFIIKKTGWHLDVAESAILIDRINQELVTVNVSPSNFKPTGGASLLWSYYNDYRGTGFSKFLRWLEPSFGLNVSYLDFDTQESFEVGAGPVVGLWNNRIFLTTGYNFSVAGQSPFYMGIGFSFSNVAKKIKVGGKIDNDGE